MAVLERGDKNKIIMNTVLSTLGLGTVLYFLSIISQTGSISESGGSKSISLLGFNLMDIYKNPVGGGDYSAGMSLNSKGIILYFLVVLATGIFIGALRVKISKLKFAKY